VAPHRPIGLCVIANPLGACNNATIMMRTKAIFATVILAATASSMAEEKIAKLRNTSVVVSGTASYPASANLVLGCGPIYNPQCAQEIANPANYFTVYRTDEVNAIRDSLKSDFTKQIQDLAPAIVKSINQAVAAGSLSDAQIAKVEQNIRQRLASEFSDRITALEAGNAALQQQVAFMQKQLNALQPPH
jgi:hypothetical protein